jgi:hypothetical protein
MDCSLEINIIRHSNGSVVINTNTSDFANCDPNKILVKYPAAMVREDVLQYLQKHSLFFSGLKALLVNSNLFTFVQI